MNFSEITYIPKNCFSFEKTYANKYICQVFDEDDKFVKVIIRESREKVQKEIDKLKRRDFQMKETLYVIATRGRNNKEIYLKCSDREVNNKILMEWTEDINEAMATFTYTECEDCAKRYFKNYNKWYITSYKASFN